MTATRAQKVRVGMFAIVTATLLGVVIVVFGGVRVFAKHDHYRVILEDSVYGLERGSPVYRNGLRTGTVLDIELAPLDPRLVVVTIELARGTPIYTDTRALMRFAGITGFKVIDLDGGSLTAARLLPGGTIEQGKTTLDELERHSRTIALETAELMKRANQLVDNLVELTDPHDRDSIVQLTQATAKDLAATTATLRALVAENREALRQSIVAIRDSARSTSEILDGQVAALVANATDFVAGLKGLVRDNESTVRATMFDLRQASRNLKDLVREVRQRPSRLLFAKPPADRKLPR